MLPHAYPFLMIDRVCDLQDGQKAVCIKNVSSGEEFSCSSEFFPSVYIVEAMAQTSGLILGHGRGGHAWLSMIRDVEFSGHARAGDCIVITSSLYHELPPLYMFSVRAEVLGRVVASGEITLSFSCD